MSFIKNIFKYNSLSTDTIRDITVESLAEMISDYSSWYDEKGIYLPPAYATDPTGWCEALHKIKRAFQLLDDERNGRGELWEARNKWKDYGEEDTVEIEALNKEIREGFAIFGEQLFYLNDPKKGNEGPTH